MHEQFQPELGPPPNHEAAIIPDIETPADIHEDYLIALAYVGSVDQEDGLHGLKRQLEKGIDLDEEQVGRIIAKFEQRSARKRRRNWVSYQE